MAGSIVVRRITRLLALCAVLLAFGLTAAAAQGEQLSVSVDDDSVLAAGGSVRVTIQLAAASGEQTPVTVTTDLGAFGADSGPARVLVRPIPSSDGENLSASVTLVGDGRAGTAVITARAGQLVDTATVVFIGAPAQIALLRPPPDRPLDASRSHLLQLEIRDRLGRPVPGASLSITTDAASTLLRSASGERGASLALSASDAGRASVTLSAEPGEIALRAVSGDAELELPLILHGAPVSLRLWALNPTLERGSEVRSAVVVARLLDAGGRAVPGQRISFNVQDDSGIRLTADGDSGSLITDAAGGVLVRATASAAQSGEYWLQADTDAGGGLSDIVELIVVGAPETLYVTAEQVDDLTLDGEEGEQREYILRAEVVDPTGRLAASGYTVRWRVVLEGGEAMLTPETVTVQRGVAISRLRIENPVGEPILQGWLVEAPQEVASEGVLADLAASGLALRRGMNVVTWVGAAKPVDAAIAPISHLAVTVWRQRPEGGGWDIYTTHRMAPRSDPFELTPGDRLHIRLDSAARLPGVTR